MNSGHTLNIKFPCNLGISCNTSINLNSCFSEILVSLISDVSLSTRISVVLIIIGIKIRVNGYWIHANP